MDSNEPAEADSAARRELIAKLTDLGAQSASLTGLFQQRAAASYGLGVSDMKALDVLMRNGPQTAGQLGAALNLTSGAVTGIADRLIRRGFATREHDPVDRRRVLISVDYAALTAGPNVYQSIGEAFQRLHESLSTEQLAFLARYQEESIALTQHAVDALAGEAGPAAE
ncbi:MarR family winged helix-turn-helix transcriptional regulator [Leifsonia shinshuensis]|uniref:MarR family transcriptional regulator n=1 Tax=Leifsonia shinshuensis TaxID=150026 RepID=A0A7G6YEP0_9MICO|nr:MarR family transcriptional regulator [Leifsonia shinshuensis]QNE36955.1 MarR family transcriptional regulator [Leifsonia shinshuensis]